MFQFVYKLFLFEFAKHWYTDRIMFQDETCLFYNNRALKEFFSTLLLWRETVYYALTSSDSVATHNRSLYVVRTISYTT